MTAATARPPEVQEYLSAVAVLVPRLVTPALPPQTK
jgi:hypothetical protein